MRGLFCVLFRRKGVGRCCTEYRTIDILLPMSGENYRFCRKCLTRDMIDKDEYFKTLRALIDEVKGEERASDELYEERLGTCTDCDRLYDGLCGACGCYVELRAVIRENHGPYDKW